MGRGDGRSWRVWQGFHRFPCRCGPRRDGGPIDDLEKRVVFENIAAFLNGGAFRGGADLDVRLNRRRAVVCSDGGFGCPWQAVDGAVEEFFEVSLRIRLQV